MSTTLRPLRRTTVGLGAGALLLLPMAAAPSPASAAPGRCDAGQGVTVVVDYGPLGGTDLFCDPQGGGKTASALMKAAGVDFEYVSGQPFVCRIEGLPGPDRESCSRTPPADAYWGLFWSDGAPRWTYSSQGVSSLRVPKGGSVGWRFQDGGARENPGPPPTGKPAPKPAPEPEPKPEPKPAPAKPSGSGSSGSSGSGSSSGSAEATQRSRATSPSATATASSPASRRPAAKQAKAERSSRTPGESASERRTRRAPAPEEPTAASTDPSETAVAEAELVEPLADREGAGAGGLLPAAVGLLVALGLAGYGVVAARRRRS